VLVVHEQLAAVAAVANDPTILQSSSVTSSGSIKQILQTMNHIKHDSFAAWQKTYLQIAKYLVCWTRRAAREMKIRVHGR
jgi:hypothetical protein